MNLYHREQDFIGEKMKLKSGMETEYAEYVRNNSQNGYSFAVVTYSERWAGLMEEAIASGKAVSDVAEDASHKANEEGITGFMYGCAVQGLAHFWEHGEELRRWHNLNTQIGDEGERANESGGVLNPAVLIINS
jgi:hypothetical protein